jgi:hypothetical protein
MTDPMRNASERDRLTPLLDFEVEPPIGRISAAISPNAVTGETYRARRGVGGELAGVVQAETTGAAFGRPVPSAPSSRPRPAPTTYATLGRPPVGRLTQAGFVDRLPATPSDRVLAHASEPPPTRTRQTRVATRPSARHLVVEERPRK